MTDTPWLAALVRPFASLMGISQGDLTDTPMADAGSVTGAGPAGFRFRTEPRGRTSFQYSFSTLDVSFEQFGAALGQALETAQETERTSALRVQEALGKTSVAFCYPGEISSKLAASWLHVDTDLDTQSRWFILAGDGVYVTLYLVGEELFSCQTQMRAESLEQLLQSCTPDGSFFAFEDAQSRFDTLAPLSLLPGQTPPFTRPRRQIPATRAFRTRLLRALASTPTATRATPTTRATRPIRKPATPSPSPLRASSRSAPTGRSRAFAPRRVRKPTSLSAQGAYFPR